MASRSTGLNAPKSCVAVPDRDYRRAAWLVMEPLAAWIEADVRELMRQSLARELGYDGFVSWALDTVGLSRQWVEAFFDDLLRLTDGPYRDWLAEADAHRPGNL